MHVCMCTCMFACMCGCRWGAGAATSHAAPPPNPGMFHMFSKVEGSSNAGQPCAVCAGRLVCLSVERRCLETLVVFGARRGLLVFRSSPAWLRLPLLNHGRLELLGLLRLLSASAAMCIGASWSQAASLFLQQCMNLMCLWICTSASTYVRMSVCLAGMHYQLQLRLSWGIPCVLVGVSLCGVAGTASAASSKSALAGCGVHAHSPYYCRAA
jgi:hypothetical protein